MPRDANRLRAVLHEYHVELLALLPSADEPWFWDLVAIASTPALAARVRAKQVERLKEHRIRRLSAQDVIERLRRSPVRITRAMTTLTLTWALERARYGRRAAAVPSRFLFEARGEAPPEGWAGVEAAAPALSAPPGRGRASGSRAPRRRST